MILPLLVVLAATPQAPPPVDKPLEETKANIVVLKGVPTSQLIPIMTVMANSLGVTCAYCHDPADWPSDVKPAKEEGRRMIRMTRAINDTHYAGKVVVSCNTCHNGNVATQAVPLLTNAGWNKPPGPRLTPELPTADEIFAHYVRALGNATVTNRLMTGVATARSGRGDPRSAPFELYQEPPRKSELKMELPYPPEGNRGIGAYFFEAPTLRQKYANVRTIDTAEIRGHSAYVVEATVAGADSPEHLYFDAQTGLLLRRHRESPTLVGPLPEDYDYDDYRTIDGLAIPFLLQWSRADYQVTHHVGAVKHGVVR